MIVVFDFGVVVFGEDDDVIFFNIYGNMGVFVVDVIGVSGDDFVFLWFFFSGVWNDEFGSGGLFGFERLDEDVVFEWFDCGCYVKIFFY